MAETSTTGPLHATGADRAADLLLTFVRLARSHRGAPTPGWVAGLLRSGELAPRHVVAFALVALFGPVTVSELAAREGLAVSTASLLVTQLAEAGLVERQEDAQDRRRTVVTVAPAHRRESEELLESRLAPLRRALARMGAARARAVFEALDIIAEELGPTPGPVPGKVGPVLL